MSGDELAQLQAFAERVRADKQGNPGIISRSRIRSLAHAVHYGQAPGVLHESVGAYIDYTLKESGLKTRDELENIRQFGAERMFAMLEEYWDYLTPLDLRQ